jgi:hypothetical protein
MHALTKFAASALSALLLVLLVACGGGEKEVPFPTLAPFPPELQQRIHEIRDRVSAIRGLPPYELVIEGIISPEALQQYSRDQLEATSEEDQADLEAYDAVLTILGLIGPEVDLKQLFADDFSGLIAGLYLIDEDRLVLVGSGDLALSIQDEITLAHEYVHSFQDGAYGIDKTREQWQEGDLEEDGYSQYSATIDCLIEGDASLADELYAEQVFGSDWRAKVDAESAASGASGPIDMPEFLLRDFVFNYRECPDFVRQLHAEGGWDAVNAAYQRPPSTTEQVLHLDKFKSRELASTLPPEDLTKQLDDWNLMDSSQFGEFDVYNYAVTLAKDNGAASAAAAGWGSGWSSVYRDKNDSGRVVVQLSFGWDTRDDLVEFLTVYEAILGGLAASIEIVDDKGNARWTAPGQFGVITIDLDLLRADIRIASHEDALKLATSDLTAFN